MKIKLNLLGIELELINKLGTLSDEEVKVRVQKLSGLISQAVLHHRRSRWNQSGDLEEVTHILVCPGMWGVAIKVGDGSKWVDVEIETHRSTPSRTTPDNEYEYAYIGNGCYRMKKKETNKEKETV